MEDSEGKERKTFVQEKAEDFAVRIVNLWKYLKNNREFDMSLQVKRSGTSIGANITEAIFAASKKDFLNKIYIAYKECGETKYWLRVLKRTEYLSIEEFESIYNDATERCLPPLSEQQSKILKTTSTKINF